MIQSAVDRDDAAIRSCLSNTSMRDMGSLRPKSVGLGRPGPSQERTRAYANVITLPKPRAVRKPRRTARGRGASPTPNNERSPWARSSCDA